MLEISQITLIMMSLRVKCSYSSDSGFYVGGGRFATLFLQQVAVAANANAASD